MTAEPGPFNNPPLLGELLTGLSDEVAAIPVSGLALDSRQVVPGDAFLAVKGHIADGRNYIDAAVRAGAVAIIADAPCAAASWSLPVVEVEGLAEKLSLIAGRFYRHPSRGLGLVGITGTNGKTSCSWLLAQMLEAMGYPCGVIGTLGNGRIGRLNDCENTTPDAVSVQRLLADWRDAGAKWAAMEVSSHGIVQHRVDELHFDAAIFTNLSRDHLDYHGSMDAYAAAKARLFSWPELPLAVVNRDDVFGREILQTCSAAQVLDYSLEDTAASAYLSDIERSIAGSRARLHSAWGEVVIETPLIGDFNLANITACCLLLLAKGFAAAELSAALKTLQPVPGRMECLRSADGVLAVVDYAHTEDALRKALSALRPLTAGQLHCVFGCGGDRDTGKRPQMGAAVAELADCLLVTSDNPRSESPQQIIDDICAGIATDKQLRCEVDRGRAIAEALASAAPGDIVLVAGKGHEDYQEIAGRRYRFSDFEQVQQALAMRAGGDEA